MPVKKFKKLAILAKTELVYGTDPVPTGSANAIEALDVTVTPLDAQQIERGLIRPTLGSEPVALAAVNAQLEFSVEVAGAGAAGTAPAYGVLLRASRLAETINVGVDVQYDPVSTGEESATLYFYMDGTQHKLIGARGTVALQFTANEIPKYRFRFIGLFTAPAEAANPTLDLSGFTKPIHVNNANTPTFTLHGFAGVLQSLEIDLNNAVVHRDLVNSESVQVTDSNANGSVTVEAPVLTTKDFFAAAIAETLAALQLVHGTVAGNIVQIDSPKVQLLQPSYSESDGIAMLTMPLVVTPNAGDDELKITVK